MSSFPEAALAADPPPTAPAGDGVGSHFNRNAAILTVIIFAVSIGGWEAVVRFFQVPAMIVPAP